VTFQKSTEKIPERIVPTLDKLYEDFHSFGALLNIKIEKLQNSVLEKSDRHEYELKHLSNLRECIRSAADVVSTASTTLNAETSEKISVRGGSDFGDLFIRDANEPMLRWFASNTVYEFEDMELPLPDTSEISTGDSPTDYQSDSDSDIENDLIRSLFNEGKKRKEHGDISGAIRHFQNCLTRLSSNVSHTSLKALQSASACGVSRSQLFENLIDTYSLLGSWSKARAAMVEKLSITERQVGKQDELYLWNTIKLADLMVKDKEYVGAHLQGRQSLRGFRKLGVSGHKGYKTCLEFLIQVCNEEGKLDEEEAYTALLASHERKVQQMESIPDIVRSSIHVTRPQSTFSPSLANNSRPFVGAAKLIQTTPTQAIPTDIVGTSSVGAHTSSLPPLDTAEQSVAVLANCEPPESQQEEEMSESLDSDKSPKSYATELKLRTTPTAEVSASFSKGEYNTSTAEKGSRTRTQQPQQPGPHNLGLPSPSMAEHTSHWPEWFGPVDPNHHDAPVNGVSLGAEFIRMLYRRKEEDAVSTILATRGRSRDVEFLTAYCKIFHDQDPEYSISRGVHGYDCLVKINSIHGYRVSGYRTEQQARDAATARACETYISATDENLMIGCAGRRDPSSDKEVCIPPINCQDRGEVTVWPEAAPALLISSDRIADIPHITISTETVQANLPATPICELPGDTILPSDSMNELIRRGARRSSSGLEMISTKSIFENLSNPQPSVTLGNSRTSRRVLSLPAIQPNTTASGTTPGDDHQHSDAYRHDSIWADSKMDHLDGLCKDNLTTVDTTFSDKVASIRVDSGVDTAFMLSGTWACQKCKSETLQYLFESECCLCFRERDDRCPSSLNDFKRQPFDRYQTLLTSLNLDALSTRHGSLLRRKILLLGDTLCGKTFLANGWSHKNIHQADTPATQTFIKSTWVEGSQLELVVWDNTGLEGYDGLRRLSYDNVHVVLICFDITDPDSFENIDYVVSLLLLASSYCSVKLTVTVERGGG
jgi:hypothetical protein